MSAPMILKHADDKSAQVAQLEEMLKTTDLSLRQRVQEKLNIVKSGIKGEQESAYEIDFHFAKNKHAVVIHDLRLCVDDRVAQIDHLIINDLHRLYVLETKHFRSGIKINEHGEFLRWDDWRKKFEGIPSPVEQNARHVKVLRDALSKVGMKNPGAFIPFVLISKDARIDRAPGVVAPEVVKADQFRTKYEADIDGLKFTTAVAGIARWGFGTSAKEIGERLLELHEPLAQDYCKEFAPSDRPGANRRAYDLRVPSRNDEKINPGADGAQHRQTCKTCLGTDLRVEYGKYGYYFKCQGCAGNTPIKLRCSVDGHSPRLRKQGSQFFRECAQCGSSSRFFTNPG